MRYIGSKLRLIDFITETIKKYCGEDLSDKVFCDIFAGTGVVGRSLAPLFKEIIANDFEEYSYIANYVGLHGYDKDVVTKYLNELNSIEGTEDSSLFQAYAGGGKYNRLYFSNANGKKIAAARKRLDEISDVIGPREYMALLFSIMDGADKVANTTSVYGAFTKNLKSNSLKDVKFVLPSVAKTTQTGNRVYMMDSNKLIKSIRGDVLYLDPPYNDRQYGANYHVLNAIARGEAPETDSITGVKDGQYNKSEYCSKRSVGTALEYLIENADFEWIILSYNNEGLLPFKSVKSILSKYGDYFVAGTGYQRYKADNNRKQAANGTVEYLHILHKGVFTNKEEVPESDPYLDIIESMKITAENVVQIKIKPIKFGAGSSQKSLVMESCAIKADTPDSNGIVYPAEVLKNAVEAFKSGNINGARLGEITHSVERKIVPKRDYIVSPMNYMGGKKKLLPQLLELFPKDITHFVDLFCGGATVGINVNAKEVLFNDNIKPLIEMYYYMYTHSVEHSLSYIDSTIKEWGLVQGEEGKDAFYRFRDEHYNATPVNDRHPLDLFILMAFSFNNQIRFAIKKNWKFNVPFGMDRSSFNGKMRENLIGFINALHSKNCKFVSEDFRDVPYFEDMFVYADPPYLISQATYNNEWDEACERALLEKLRFLDKHHDVKFALSNVLVHKGNENVILKGWIEENGYKVIHLNKSYANSYYNRKERDTETDEVLIVNY